MRSERVNHGGEPGRDDDGLPRVDIQIPDDARELYRDVQAYHRELRALRRQERSRRWRAPLHRTGLVVPVIAGCLILAMIAGMILTMFSANPYFARIAGPATNAAAARNPSASSAASVGATDLTPATSAAGARTLRLPAKTIVVLPHKRVPLQKLTATALVMIPAKCHCTAAVRRLLAQATSADVTVYLVGMSRSSVTGLNSLAPASARGTAVLAIDSGNALNSTFQPHGLEILLVDSTGAVKVRSGLKAGFHIAGALRNLKQPG